MLKKIIYKIQPDTIVHLAGQSTIDMVDKKINEYIHNIRGAYARIILKTN